MVSPEDPVQSNSPDFLAGGGRMGTLMRNHDWSKSPLGPPQGWPQSLRSVVGLLLNSKFPMFVAWGPELGFLYNDPYAVVLGAKHPQALGARFHDIWSEIWPDISPLIDAAMAGQASYREDLPLLMDRKGYDEQTWFTFSYSPVRDESGAVAGMFCVCTETTAQVLGQKRREALLELDDRLRDIEGTADLSFAASELLGQALGAVRVGYGVIDSARGVVIVERNWSAPGFSDVAGVHELTTYGAYGDLLAGLALANNDASTDARTAANVDAFDALGIRAHLDVPVVEDGRAVAEMFVHSAAARVWSKEEVAFVRDVAERTHAAIKRRGAEQELRESEERLRLATEHAAIGLWDVDEVHQRLLWPPIVKRMFGISPGVPVAMTDFYNGVHPDDREAVAAAYAAARDPDRRALYHVEYRTVGKEDNVVRWVAAKGRGVFGDDGRCLRVVGTAVDITDRKHGESRCSISTTRLNSRWPPVLPSATACGTCLRTCSPAPTIAG